MIKLEKICIERGILQKELARQVGVSPVAVVHWFRHGRKPQLRTADKIMEYLYPDQDFSVGDLFKNE